MSTEAEREPGESGPAEPRLDTREKFRAQAHELNLILDKLRPGTGPGVETLVMMAWDEAWQSATAALRSEVERLRAENQLRLEQIGKLLAAIGPMDEFDTYEDAAARVRDMRSEVERLKGCYAGKKIQENSLKLDTSILLHLPMVVGWLLTEELGNLGVYKEGEIWRNKRAELGEQEVTRLRERLKHISFLLTGNDYALETMTPREIDATVTRMRDLSEEKK